VSLANQSYRITTLNYELETNPVPGAVIGLFAESFKGRRFSFQFDVAYASKGHCTTTQSVTVNHLDNDRITVNKGKAAKSRFHYLSLVPLARYRFDLERMTPYFILGPRVDFLLNYGTESEYPLESQNHTLVGLTAGGGLEFHVGDLGFFAELQYLPDLSPVSNTEPLLINNNMLSLSLGIRWIAFSE
jgi:opacity protein-like surface antigen